MTQVKKAIVALLIVLVINSFIPILLRVSENTISANAVIFNRLWIATAILGLWQGLSMLNGRLLHPSTEMLLDPLPFKLFSKIHILLLLVIMAILFLSLQLLWAYSLTQTSVANSAVLHSITPLFTTFIGWSLFGQKFDRVFLAGIVIALIGSIALTANDFSIAIDKLEGDALALLSAALWAGYLLVVEKLQTQLGIMVIITGNCVFSTLFILPILLVTRCEIFPYSWDQWPVLIVLGITILSNEILTTYSFKYLSSGLVASFLLLNPIITAIFAWLMFSETLNLLNLIAFFVILFGIYLTTFSKYAIKI